MRARMVVGDGWYCGVAPVPGARVNIGIVVGAAALGRDQASEGPEEVARSVVAQLPGPPEAWRGAPDTDELRVALPLAHRVARAGFGPMALVGDAAGFIDPLSGEGLHRALVSAEMAASAIRRWLAGDRRALDDYDRHLRARFQTKDVVSWILQLFIARPALIDYALDRLARRKRQRETLTLVLTDQLRASRVLDPRFLLSLLTP